MRNPTMTITVCAGGGLLGTVAARALLFQKKGENGRNIAKAVDVPEDALPADLPASTELSIVQTSQLRTIESLAALRPDELKDWEVKDVFERIYALVGLFFVEEVEGEAKPTVEKDRYARAAELLEDQAREFARGNLGNVASVMMSLVGAITGRYDGLFARCVLGAAMQARQIARGEAKPAEWMPVVAAWVLWEETLKASLLGAGVKERDYDEAKLIADFFVARLEDDGKGAKP